MKFGLFLKFFVIGTAAGLVQAVDDDVGGNRLRGLSQGKPDSSPGKPDNTPGNPFDDEPFMVNGTLFDSVEEFHSEGEPLPFVDLSVVDENLILVSDFASFLHELKDGDDRRVLQSYDGTYSWRNIATGRHLDSNYEGKVYTLSANDGDFQVWNMYYLSASRSYFFQNQQTNRVLDSNMNGNVYTLEYNGGDFQKWRLEQTALGYIRWRNVATGRMLDSNHNGDCYTHFDEGDGNNHQNWQMIHRY